MNPPPAKSFFAPATLAFFGLVLALGTCVGFALAIAGAEEANLLLTAAGVFIAGVFLICVVALVLEWWVSRRRPGLVLGHEPGGRPATVAPRPRWTVALSAVTLAVTLVPTLTAAVVLLTRPEWPVGVLLLLAAGWLGRYLAPFLGGRVEPGGVYLSAAGVTNVRDGSSWHVRWDSVAVVVPDRTTVVLLHWGADIERVDAGPWGQRVFGPPIGAFALGIDTRFLAVNPDSLALLIMAHVENPDLRPMLGTPASLQWFREQS